MLAMLRMPARFVLALAAVAGLAAPAALVAAEDDFLPPDQVFRYTTSSDGANVEVKWQVAKGYYLYQGRMGVESTTPGVTVGAPVYPKGEIHEDEYFGKQTIFRGAFVVRAPLTRAAGSGDTLMLKLKLQGCADAGLCYPPQTWQTTVKLPPAAASGVTGSATAAATPGASAPAKDVLGAVLALGRGTRGGATLGAASSPTVPAAAANPATGASAASGDEFLPPEQAFQLDAVADGPDRVRLTWEIANGYYLYRERLKVKTPSGSAQLGQLSLPTGQKKTDEYFGEQEVYHDELVATIAVSRAGGAAVSLPLEVTYQGCAEAGLCYPPITQKLTVQLPAAGAGGATAGGVSASGSASASAGGGASGSGGGFVSEQDRLAALIRDGSLPLVLATFFGLGLLLAFTPCCLPMVPILSGIIAGHGPNVTTGRAFALSLTYVLGMAFTYTVAGAAFAAAGQQVQAVFQQTWIVVLFASLFIVLALSMFGLFTVQMPGAIQTRLADLSNRQAAGTFGGVAVMGALSALIVTTCVAPPLVATLAVIGQSGNVARGAAALFTMSLGMGAPLLAVGASAGKLLPKAGPWMDTVKKFFGVMMLAVSAWMLARIVPDRFALVLWAVPALAAAWLLLTGMKNRSTAHWGLRIAGAAAGLYGIALLAGAALGGTDPFSPLPRAGSAAHAGELSFRTIKSLDDLDRAVGAARAAGRPVMLDFYADWCTSCREMERFTFSDAAVRDTLGGVVLLRADVTKNDEQDQALLRRFGIFGPPTIAFYGADGTERRNYRVVGYMKAPEFARLAREALAGAPAAPASAALEPRGDRPL